MRRAMPSLSRLTSSISTAIYERVSERVEAVAVEGDGQTDAQTQTGSDADGGSAVSLGLGRRAGAVQVEAKSTMYRVTHLVDSNLPLTSKQKFCFGLTRSGQARPIRNFCFDVNWRFESRRCVTL